MGNLYNRVYYSKGKLLCLIDNGVNKEYEILDIGLEDEDAVVYKARDKHTGISGILRMYYPSVVYRELIFNEKDNVFHVENSTRSSYLDRQAAYLDGYKQLIQLADNLPADKLSGIVTKFGKSLSILTISTENKKSGIGHFFKKIKEEKKNFESVPAVFIWSPLSEKVVNAEEYRTIIQAQPGELSLNKVYSVSHLVDVIMGVLEVIPGMMRREKRTKL